jgi:arginine decarboxylase
MGKLQPQAYARSDAIRPWSVRDSVELYNIANWGGGFFGINAEGHVTVQPSLGCGAELDLKVLIDDLKRRGIQMPLLIRFTDILRTRIEALNEAFRHAIGEYGYKGRYLGVYPIKVNQQRHVVEEIVAHGRQYQFGLEAGSKPELLAVLALLDSPDALIICNGYKDEEFVRIALHATKMGRTLIIVIEKFSELELIATLAQEMNVVPRIGVRAKLASRGSGKWEASGGDRSKFGLTITELVRAIAFLREREMLDCLDLLHFHLGSQITNIRSIRNGLEEACRLYVEMAKAGAPMRFLDVGGGLAVDYDGSRTNFISSANYSLQEYANDVVSAVLDACDAANVAHPIIVSESGRAITAHHSALVFNVLGSSELGTLEVPNELPSSDHDMLYNLLEVCRGITRKNFQEAYHDAIHYRDECITLFKHGYLSLDQRSRAETIFWACCQKILRIVRDLEYVPDELEGLERALADTYFCNFSCFQSLPDHWAVNHLFPVVPIHRLNEEPTRRAVLADITCDSDGKIDRFIDLHDVKDVIELHPLNGEDYYIGVFITGAYQEILGDMHNLFGDTNVVHVRLEEDGGYRVEQVIKGDTVKEMLHYVQYAAADLVDRLRDSVEVAVRQGLISLEESGQFLAQYERSLESYTYLNRTKPLA